VLGTETGCDSQVNTYKGNFRTEWIVDSCNNGNSGHNNEGLGGHIRESTIGMEVGREVGMEWQCDRLAEVNSKMVHIE
jgi:hypothetical protein